MDLSWIERPLECEGASLRERLFVDRLTDHDLRALCFRMRVIFDTIENETTKGGVFSFYLNHSIDSLESKLLHDSPRLVEWLPLVEEFGRAYGLDGTGPIQVSRLAVESNHHLR